jgi:hypothetical protein
VKSRFVPGCPAEEPSAFCQIEQGINNSGGE